MEHTKLERHQMYTQEAPISLSINNFYGFIRTNRNFTFLKLSFGSNYIWLEQDVLKWLIFLLFCYFRVTINKTRELSIDKKTPCQGGEASF